MNLAMRCKVMNLHTNNKHWKIQENKNNKYLNEFKRSL